MHLAWGQTGVARKQKAAMTAQAANVRLAVVVLLAFPPLVSRENTLAAPRLRQNTAYLAPVVFRKPAAASSYLRHMFLLLYWLASCVSYMVAVSQADGRAEEPTC